MKYVAIDELNHFSFHDAELQKIDIYEDKMRWLLSAINATVQNSQNSYDEDMCIIEAEIIFEHFKIENIVIGEYKVYDSSHKLIESVEAITVDADKYDDILKKTLNGYCYLYSMEELHTDDDKNVVCFIIDGGDDTYHLTISFSKSTVIWDNYDGKAWYEHDKWKKK
ncbi:hypothetical protein [Propionispora vibrioides]|uniref:Uncharacterized protein n=1 Tax=Propionispora vibrioides TaxID=112903 RepID=A0A1H8XQU4_9FIRM|nr:hypothetical protein [Propionispora vibrioides]SEP42141.1 hypothetical protein SAMN04490178_12755 [Propionispora vibrioides]